MSSAGSRDGLCRVCDKVLRLTQQSLRVQDCCPLLVLSCTGQASTPWICRACKDKNDMDPRVHAHKAKLIEKKKEQLLTAAKKLTKVVICVTKTQCVRWVGYVLALVFLFCPTQNMEHEHERVRT
jgi:hypothetical protein